MPPGPRGSTFSPPGGYGPGNTISIDFPNAGSLLGRFKQHAAGVTIQMDRLAEALGFQIVDAAKDLVAVDEGATKDSIRLEHRAGDWVVVVDRFGERPEVPIYLEIGTWKMAARPFLKPAGDLVLASNGLMRASTQVGGLLAPTGIKVY